MQTVAPARARPSAIARPMPRDAPVTSAIRPVRSTRTVTPGYPYHQRRALAEQPERDHPLDHPGQTACQVSWLVLACKAALAGAPGESYDLAVDPGAARTGTLELLQDEKTAALAGREPGVVTVVGSDQSRSPVGGEEQLLELSVGAATEGNVQIAFADQAVRVADGASAADGPVGHRAAKSLGVMGDGDMARGEVRERLQ